ncbi:MAG: hypothetical protein EOM73_00975 [Bacteroidia bacterium]|nr:hypothetical protein [Bacteroidia bacterium]
MKKKFVKVPLTLILITIISIGSAIAQKIVKGTVTDVADGSTLPGVNIVVKGTTIGVSSDIDGSYEYEK